MYTGNNIKIKIKKKNFTNELNVYVPLRYWMKKKFHTEGMHWFLIKKKFHVQLSVKYEMLTIFWEMIRYFIMYLLEEGSAVNRDSYCQLLKQY